MDGLQENPGARGLRHMNLGGDTKVNLTSSNALLLEPSKNGLDILSQILRGFGAQRIHACMSADEAMSIVSRTQIDLFLVDQALENEASFSFVKWLRRSKIEPTCYAPVVFTSGHTGAATVAKARDSGANFLVLKPVTPQVLMKRILWIMQEKRLFIEGGDFIGPDRRFKNMGPPPGADGRRDTDLDPSLGEAAEPNLSQIEIDAFVKPQRVYI